MRNYTTTRSGKKLYHIHTEVENDKISYELVKDMSNIDCGSNGN